MYQAVALALSEEGALRIQRQSWRDVTNVIDLPDANEHTQKEIIEDSSNTLHYKFALLRAMCYPIPIRNFVNKYFTILVGGGFFVMARHGEPLERGSRHKGTLWTREKIAKLIEMYEHHECLWNHYTEDYKHKEKRRRAIEEICSSLEITKMDFGKKIHNLRNQFNSEMKKMERRVEETGDDAELATESCRWKHFQSLKFLRAIIEPRPGGYHSKLRKTDIYLKNDNTSEDEMEDHSAKPITVPSLNQASEQITEYQFEDTTIACNAETVVAGSNSQRDNKNMLTSTADARGNNFLSVPSAITRMQNVCSIDKNSPTQLIVSQCQNSGTEENQHGQTVCCCSKSQEQCSSSTAELSLKKGLEDTCGQARPRDQWDAFGELVATEFRNLNSDSSRKKLKRKILQAIVEVGEEDDGTG